jgi:hypothetical protein
MWWFKRTINRVVRQNCRAVQALAKRCTTNSSGEQVDFPYTIHEIKLPWWKRLWYRMFPSIPKIVEGPWYDIHGNRLP